MGILSDGIDDSVQSINNSSLTGNPSFSISFWLKVPTGAAHDSNYPGYIFWGATTQMNSALVSVYLNDITRIFVGFLNGGQRMVNAISLDTWHHICYVRTGGGNAFTGNVLYVDGSVVSLQNVLTGGTPNITAGKYNFGLSKTPSDEFIECEITDMTIWNATLTLAEVQRIYNAKRKYMPFQIQPSNLINYWPMNDGKDGISADGDTVKDLSVNGNNGIGNDGANNTGLIWKAEEVLSYPSSPILLLEGNTFPVVDAGADKDVFHYGVITPFSDATFSDDDGTVDHAYIDVNGGGFTEILQGSFSTLQDAVQAYTVKFITTGAIIVTLKVEDNDGATSQDTMTMNVLTVDSDDVLEINGIKYDVVDSVNWDRESHHLKIPVVKRV